MKRRGYLQTDMGEGAERERADGGMGSEVQTMRASCKHESTFVTLTWFLGNRCMFQPVKWVRYTKLSLVRTKPVHIWIIVSTSILTATLEANIYIAVFRNAA